MLRRDVIMNMIPSNCNRKSSESDISFGSHLDTIPTFCLPKGYDFIDTTLLYIVKENRGAIIL
jgi:hypothetical protein